MIGRKGQKSPPYLNFEFEHGQNIAIISVMSSYEKYKMRKQKYSKTECNDTFDHNCSSTTIVLSDDDDEFDMTSWFPPGKDKPLTEAVNIFILL